MESIEKIGRHQYAHLKSIAEDKLSIEQMEQIEQYEEGRGNTNSNQKVAEYMERINTKPSESVKFTPKQLYHKFLEEWTLTYQKDIVIDRDMSINLRVLNRYFAGDPSFAEDCSDISEPSLDKGLVIFGRFGNGKTSTMKILQRLLALPGHSFKGFTANQVVELFEACESESDKAHFWKTMIEGRCWFDDVLTERTASNYGKVEIFKDILEKRYDQGQKTFITCNPSDLDNPLEDFSERYGERVYDRMFEMFNVIIWKGKSKRK